MEEYNEEILPVETNNGAQPDDGEQPTQEELVELIALLFEEGDDE